MGKRAETYMILTRPLPKLSVPVSRLPPTQGISGSLGCIECLARDPDLSANNLSCP